MTVIESMADYPGTVVKTWTSMGPPLHYTTGIKADPRSTIETKWNSSDEVDKVG